LEKLKTFDENIANTLKPDIDSKALDSLFSFTFSCDDGISFNKRGSGVKRLMLLSFFLADAERKNTSNKGVIYAIEEPETSQHPDFQIMLMNTLKQLSTANDRQILLTTHTPEIVKMVNKENLIFVQKSDDKSVIVQQNDGIELKKVADTLGILPFVVYKGVIFVEGTTDIKFLKNLNNLPTLKAIFDLTQFTFIPLYGSGNVDTWIKENYLKDSNVKCLYFKDRDDNTAPTIVQDNNVIKTNKREIENYIPFTVVENRFDIQFTETEKQNWADIDVASVVVNDHGVHLNLDNKQSENIVKNILQSKEVWDNITFTEADLSEFQNWFNRIKAFFCE
jgi:predicted ATP-dependent endonuclease of OLD family